MDPAVLVCFITASFCFLLAFFFLYQLSPRSTLNLSGIVSAHHFFFWGKRCRKYCFNHLLTTLLLFFGMAPTLLWYRPYKLFFSLPVIFLLLSTLAVFCFLPQFLWSHNTIRYVLTIPPPLPPKKMPNKQMMMKAANIWSADVELARWVLWGKKNPNFCT